MKLHLRDQLNTVNVISPYPAIGKGTVVSHFIQQLQQEGQHVALTEVGAICRDHVMNGTDLGTQIKDYSARGVMVPDEVIVPEVLKNLRAVLPSNILFIDGFPRTPAQIESYEDFMFESGRTDHFIHLDAPREVAEERMVKRGLAAIAVGKKPRGEDIDAEVRKTRLDVAENDMKPVIEHYAEQGRLTVIDATRSIEGVREQVLAAIFKHAPILQGHHRHDHDSVQA